MVWPWAPSISSPGPSGAVSGKHDERQPQGGRREAFLHMEWRYLRADGWEEVKHTFSAAGQEKHSSILVFTAHC